MRQEISKKEKPTCPKQNSRAADRLPGALGSLVHQLPQTSRLRIPNCWFALRAEQKSSRDQALEGAELLEPKPPGVSSRRHPAPASARVLLCCQLQVASCKWRQRSALCVKRGGHMRRSENVEPRRTACCPVAPSSRIAVVGVGNPRLGLVFVLLFVLCPRAPSGTQQSWRSRNASGGQSKVVLLVLEGPFNMLLDNEAVGTVQWI